MVNLSWVWFPPLNQSISQEEYNVWFLGQGSINLEGGGDTWNQHYQDQNMDKGLERGADPRTKSCALT